MESPANLLLVGDVAGKPVEALVQALAGGGAGALNVPMALAQRVQAKLVGDLSGVHGVGQILLVSEHQQHSVAKLVLFRGSGKARSTM
eukprot:1195024-Prorocentrum_minimum.AAC.5